LKDVHLWWEQSLGQLNCSLVVFIRIHI
jgi:hypothetical protein